MLTKEERCLIIFRRKESGLTIDEVAHSLHMSKSNLSRIENGKVSVTFKNKERFKESLCVSFRYGRNLFTRMRFDFEYIMELLVNYELTQAYFFELYRGWYGTPLTTTAYPICVLVDVSLCAIQGTHPRFIKRYIPIIDETLYLYAEIYQKFYYLGKATFYYTNKDYKSALYFSNKVTEAFSAHLHIDILNHHLSSMILVSSGDTEGAKIELNKTLSLLDRKDCPNRRISLKVLLSTCYRNEGNYVEALKLDKENVEYAEERGFISNKYALLKNIGWTYYLMKNYGKAIDYYQQAEEIDCDKNLCFYVALCNYRLDFKDQAEEYIAKGRLAKNAGVAFPYLLDWLELMINKKYSKRAENKLLLILEKYEDTLHIESKQHVYRLLIEHYLYHGEMDKVEMYEAKVNEGVVD